METQPQTHLPDECGQLPMHAPPTNVRSIEPTSRMPALWTTALASRCRSAVSAAIVVTAAAAFGCAGGGRYAPAELPAEFQAAPVENAHAADLSQFGGPMADNEVIRAGDVLKVSLAAGLDADDVATFFLRVGEDGTASLPEIGRLQFAQLHVMQAEQQIASACVQRGLYRQPLVTVAMEQQRLNRVTVVGAVNEPGIKELPRGTSYLLAAIVSAGALADDAGTNIQIRLPAAHGRLAGHNPMTGVQLASNTESVSDQLVCLNLADAVNQGSGGHYLPDGSVVTVERRQPEPIQVIGLVREPGQYDFPTTHELRLFGALAQAGGLSQKLADEVLVIRRNPEGTGVAYIEISLAPAKENADENLLLAPGDVVSVERTPITAVSSVLTSMIRFGMSASMPIF